MKKVILLVLFCSFIFQLQAQESESKPQTIQPTIMVIPFVAKNQSIRKKLESDNNILVAVTKVKEGFDNRGVNTIDLRAKLKQLSNIDVMESDAETTEKDEVLRLSGADIYVEVQSKKNYSGSGNSVSLILTAFDAFSGQSLSNKVSNSPSFYTKNFEKLTEKAVESVIEEFLNTIQVKFDEIRENGRSLVLTIGMNEESEIDFDKEYNDGADLLSDLIEDWVEENAYKGYYHMQGITTTKMIFDDVRVPIKELKMGKSYRVSHFVRKLRKFLRNLDLKFDRSIQGNNIVITIK